MSRTSDILDRSATACLQVTCAATDTVARLVTAAGFDGNAGLRITHNLATGSLVMSLAVEPASGDQVVRAGGALVFLDAHAQQCLQDKVLDVRIDDDCAAFYVSRREDHDDRTDRAERDRRTAEALRADLKEHRSPVG